MWRDCYSGEGVEGLLVYGGVEGLLVYGGVEGLLVWRDCDC